MKQIITTEQITHSALCKTEHITNGAFDETRNILQKQIKSIGDAGKITHNAADKCIAQEPADSLRSIAHNIIDETEGVADEVVGQTTNIKHVSVDKI